jgi:hypothetical protein
MSLNFKNSFGEINDNEISFLINNNKYLIKNDTIKQIRFIKTQKYHLNYVTFFIALYLLFNLKYKTFSNQIQICLFILSLVFLVITYYLKYFKYKLLLLKKNDYLSIEISKSKITEVTEFVNQFYKIVKTSN